MDIPADKFIRQVTRELSQERLWELGLQEPGIDYIPVPDSTPFGEGEDPIWRVRFELAFNPERQFGLDINGEVVLGRTDSGPGVVSLDDYDAEELGVSRRHAMLRPTDSKLFVVDLGSTNGTRINGRSIGVHMPYGIANGDLLTLGKLEFCVRVVDRPLGRTELLGKPQSRTDQLLASAKAITAHLEMEDVLKQAVEKTVSLASVDEASIWLVDEQTNELVLEAECGFEDDCVQCMRLSVTDTMAGQVISTGKPMWANRTPGGDPIKLKTGYLVEAVMYLPLTLGGVTFGVLSVAHREEGGRFSEQDRQSLSEIADFTAIAVQNARSYQSANGTLLRHTKIATALNYALSYDVKHLLKSIIGYTSMMDTFDPLTDDSADIVAHIAESADDMSTVLDQILDVIKLSDTNIIAHNPCDLVEAVTCAVEDRRQAADDKLTTLALQIIGSPYPIYGDRTYLHRAALNLIDNAIRYSPLGARVDVSLGFMSGEVIIRVCDNGPGIPEENLPHLFDRYFRGKDTASGKSGIGLGLELVRATVEAHRGRVTARNAEDGGAEFVIVLPGTLRVT